MLTLGSEFPLVPGAHAFCNRCGDTIPGHLLSAIADSSLFPSPDFYPT